MRRNVYGSAIFTGDRPLCTKFYLDRVVPINHSWHQKTRDTVPPDGKDRIPLHSLVLTQYRSKTERWMDGQKDGYAVAYTALAACCKFRLKVYVGYGMC